MQNTAPRTDPANTAPGNPGTTGTRITTNSISRSTRNTATTTTTGTATITGATSNGTATAANATSTTGATGTTGKAPRTGTTGTPGTTGDPRLHWSSTDGRPTTPVLRFRRDGILPTIAAALSVRGETLTGTAGKADRPPTLHPLVQDFLDTLTSGQRERFTGRCPEAILLTRHLTTTENNRSKRASRKPLTPSEARRSLKHAKITARHIREEGDPLHDGYAPPCRSCEPLLAHFGVRPVDLSASE